MHSIVNTEQAEAWNGYEGNHWADHQDRYDAVNSGFNDHLLAAAAIGERDRVLDIGCGNGQVTRLAARRARLGHAAGIDLSAPMLQRARATAADEGVANVTFEQGDAQIHPFPAAGFDVAVSRFGIMFFADPVAAFANIGHALRPGGRLVFLALRDMSDNDLGAAFAAMAEHLPPDSLWPASDGPESLADPARIREVLTGAGYEKVTSVPVEAPQVWGKDAADAAGFLQAWGPVRHMLGQVDQTAAARARDALTAAMRPYEEPDAVRLRGAAWLVTATHP
ncbi:class I SAM-dependent methyltransferase [Streptosporangium sp. 'caverna']|uniref:class I SAM-dependent methyltransferase n=1 Tax=Streptosporangium sp. 'caverna' TaxID=2202249 RepID=UPI000D7D6204|nr:class I SAM-dependent methyltransferase [Streptosporangium sp. 'caverna']AWS41824.1 SAM-dependent methyltransferase [Streptosporangium sp. 'caverna']